MSSQRTLSLDFREFDPSDYGRLIEIYNANYPDYALSVAEQRSRDESIDQSNYLLRRIVGYDRETITVVGFGSITQPLDMFHPRKFMTNIYVDPKFQGRGVGNAIFDRLSTELKDLQAEVIWTMNKEDLPGQREFFRRRGFEEKRRDWESRLDLSSFDPAKFQDYFSKMRRIGVSFTTLAKEQNQGDPALRELHDLVQHITADMPRQADFTPLSFEQWKKLLVNSPRLIPEGYMIAREDSRYVGMSNVLRNEKEPLTLSQDDTGVRREYRGIGIATALKVKVIEFAKRSEYHYIKTWNDSTNAPMLAVNTKLGFKRQIGWILMEKTLSPRNSS